VCLAVKRNTIGALRSKDMDFSEVTENRISGHPIAIQPFSLHPRSSHPSVIAQLISFSMPIELVYQSFKTNFKDTLI
jgi:hypothetical protein